jgi:Fusaric acid resistance protein-like
VQDAPAMAWRWSAALPGALFAIPAAIVTLRDPSVGLALADGAVPAAAVGITPTRGSRHVIVVVGACIGLSLVLGAALATSWLTAVPGIFVLCLGAAVLSDLGPVERLLMLLAVPMIGAGLSFSDVGTAAELAIVMVIGSTYCWLLALCWPNRPAPERPKPTPVSRAILVDYGVRLGAAGAITAGLGFAFGLEHKGWATAAALLVMRPTGATTQLRGVGRALAVVAGTAAACVVALLEAPPVAVAALVLVAVTGLAATRSSRWYVTGGFTTFITILLLIYGSPDQADTRFVERVGGTLLGVGVALLMGVAVPRLRQRRAASSHSGDDTIGRV